MWIKRLLSKSSNLLKFKEVELYSKTIHPTNLSQIYLSQQITNINNISEETGTNVIYLLRPPVPREKPIIAELFTSSQDNTDNVKIFIIEYFLTHNL